MRMGIRKKNNTDEKKVPDRNCGSEPFFHSANSRARQVIQCPICNLKRKIYNKLFPFIQKQIKKTKFIKNDKQKNANTRILS